MTDKNRGKERYEILFEDINSKMDLVLEGYGEFGNKLDEAKKERQEIRSDLTEKIEFVASSLHKKIEDTRSDLSKRIDGTEKRLEEKIGKVGYKLDAHEERIEVLEKKVLI